MLDLACRRLLELLDDRIALLKRDLVHQLLAPVPSGFNGLFELLVLDLLLRCELLLQISFEGLQVLHESLLLVITHTVSYLVPDHVLVRLDLLPPLLVLHIDLFQQCLDWLLVVALQQFLLGFHRRSTQLVVFVLRCSDGRVQLGLRDNDLHAFVLIFDRVQQAFDLLDLGD